MEKKILSYLLAIFDLWGYDKCFLSLLESHNVSYGIKIMEFYHQTLRTMWSSPKKSFKVELMSHWIWDFQTTPNPVAQKLHV
jgi:hypothetical protein